jgi:ABC-type sugar transport system ATPase subunit
MAAIRFDQVSKVFADGTRAVDALDLEVAEGEFMVLVGPSGCGKTTALRMVAGLEEISDGTIRIGEKTVNDLSPKDRDVAMVFQNYALYPHMTVADNLAFGLKLRHLGRPEIQRRVREAAAALDLEEYLERKPKALSGGQRQRVALGRAIVREPAAFLMDEPLSNLDAALRVQTRAEILKLQKRLSTTTIYVTHDQVEAMTMGDRIAVMRRGVLQQIGTPEELRAARQHLRRHVHRLAGDEPRPRVPRRHRRRLDHRRLQARAPPARLSGAGLLRHRGRRRGRRVPGRRAARARAHRRPRARRQAARGAAGRGRYQGDLRGRPRLGGVLRRGHGSGESRCLASRRGGFASRLFGLLDELKPRVLRGRRRGSP